MPVLGIFQWEAWFLALPISEILTGNDCSRCIYFIYDIFES